MRDRRRSDGTRIYGVGMLPEFRGRGVGPAVTAAVVEAGIASGAGSAYLWATKMGFPVYRRPGFRQVENKAVRVHRAAA